MQPTISRPEIDHSTIPGWGIDADPQNDPTYPIRKRTPADHAGFSWERPPLQPATVEVLHSNERPGLTAVFGVSKPPSGLSGLLRRFAFRYSESSYGHWLPLMLADRINVCEGVVQDLARGHIPNVFQERGWGADWRYNRKALVTRVAVAGIFAGIIAAALLSTRGRQKSIEA